MWPCATNNPGNSEEQYWMGLVLSDIKSFYQTLLGFKWCGTGMEKINKWMEQNKRQEATPDTNVNLMSEWDGTEKQGNREKRKLNKSCRYDYSYAKIKIKWSLHLTPFIKIDSRWVNILNLNSQTFKLKRKLDHILWLSVKGFLNKGNKHNYSTNR